MRCRHKKQTINTTDASLGVAFGENQVKQLPLESRNVGDLLSLQAGVVYTGNNPSITQGQKDTDTRSGAVNGARSDQSNVTLDGIPVNPKGGYAFQSVLPVTLDSVEEFRVTTSNAEADAGSAGGAQVALVTKSGIEHASWLVYEYNRNSFVSANDYFLKQSELGSGQPNQPQFLNRNIFGGSVGGPTRKIDCFSLRIMRRIATRNSRACCGSCRRRRCAMEWCSTFATHRRIAPGIRWRAQAERRTRRLRAIKCCRPDN